MRTVIHRDGNKDMHILKRSNVFKTYTFHQIRRWEGETAYKPDTIINQFRKAPCFLFVETLICLDVYRRRRIVYYTHYIMHHVVDIMTRYQSPVDEMFIFLN